MELFAAFATINCLYHPHQTNRLDGLMTREEIIANKANLRGAFLRGANLSGANLSGANLRRANLSGADLWGADLREVDLGEASLRKASLRGAFLGGADLSGADLSGADLSGANLSGANLRGADLSRADLSYADLSGANMSGANMSGANLRGAGLREASLSGANLRGAGLREASLSGANLRGADLSGADLDRSKIIREQIHPLWGMRHYPIIYGYKWVDAFYQSPYKAAYSCPPLIYEIGKEVKVEEWNEDERVACGAGINLATLDWCLRNKENPTHKILLVSHTWEDVVCIPLATDGKYRVKRCQVIKEIILDEPQ